MRSSSRSTSTDTVEVHCHGGRRVVRWVVEQFTARGCVGGHGASKTPPRPRCFSAHPTLRTAAILLDQFHGAFDREVARILGLLDTDPEAAQAALARTCPARPGRAASRRAVEGRRRGPPNVGKSSLVNALAGFQRAVVSEVAGTTRDVVTVQLAFDGWPVELTDTAGLRDAEGLEAEGIERAKKAVDDADLVVWVMDAADPECAWPKPDECRMDDAIFVANKIDLVPSWEPGEI